MTTKNEVTTKHLCEECGEAEAVCALCFEIVKRYGIDENGFANWSDDEVIQNENDPILMCEACASEFEV